jgi:hypothetical protein
MGTAYRVIGDAAMLLHFAFLAYVTLGGFLAWHRPRLLPPHAATALYALGITVIGWPCPLTHLETWARRRAGQTGLPPEGFVDHYLTGVLYPAQHLPTIQLAVAATVLLSWTGALLRARGHTRHPGPNDA